MVNKRCSILLY